MSRGVQAVTDTALAHLNVDDLISTLLTRIRDELHVDAATVLLLDGDGQDLVATASVGLEEEVAQGVRVPFGGGFAGRIAAQQQPMQIEQITPTSVLNQILLDRGVTSVLGVPMIATGNLLGVLHVASLRPRHFTEAEVNLLQVAAERLASATQAHVADVDRATTLALQRSLLPARRIDLPFRQFAAIGAAGRSSADDRLDPGEELPHHRTVQAGRESGSLQPAEPHELQYSWVHFRGCRFWRRVDCAVVADGSVGCSPKLLIVRQLGRNRLPYGRGSLNRCKRESPKRAATVRESGLKKQLA